MICPKCKKVELIRVMRFTKQRNGVLFVCRNCGFETRMKNLNLNSFEIMQNNFNNTHKNKSKMKK